MTNEKFTLLKLGKGLDPKGYVQMTKDGPRCLEQIIIAQRDELNQKYCIYALQTLDKSKQKQFQVRVKSIDFIGKPATAIHFYDLTSHVKTIKLTSKLLKQEKKNARQTLSPAKLSHDVNQPLMSQLMLLQSLMETMVTESQKSLIMIMIAQTNMLVCLINDILDCKLIELRKFNKRMENFDPT